MAITTTELAREITRASSQQSYYTARLMVDSNLEFDCYRAYAYFRWVDDVVDIECQTKAERLAFIQRQKELLNALYRLDDPSDLTPEEKILADLIQNDRGECFRLRSYIRNFLAIIEFDAERKDNLITQQELDWYAATLGKAVTDGIQHFVCHGHPYPESDERYMAATGAHVAHMLRDLLDDIAEGYINIPQEQIEAHQIDLQNFEPESLSPWVKTRVELARQYFAGGKRYLIVLLSCVVGL